MAIAFVDAGTVEITVATATYTLPLPGGTAATDVFVIELTTKTNSGSSQVSALPGSGTFVTVDAGSSDTGGGTIGSSIYVWVPPASPPSSISWTLVGTRTGSITWSRWSGVDTTAPRNVSALGAWAFTANPNIPTATTTVANTHSVLGVTTASGSRTVTVAGGLPEIANAAERNGIQIDGGLRAATGATGTVGITVVEGSINSRGWRVQLAPGAGGTDATLTTVVGNADATGGSATFSGTTGNATLTTVAGTATVAGGTVAFVGSPTFTQAVAGVVTADGFTVSTRTAGATSVRLKVATNSGLTTGVVYGGAATPDGDGYAKPAVTGLSSSTEYWYGVEMTDAASGTTTTASQGSPKTLPTVGAAASFGFGFGSCAANGSTATASFTRISARDPLLFFHTGDFHYADRTDSTQANHRADLEGQISANSGLRTLLAAVPTYSMASDHDSGGGDNALPGAYTAPNRAARKQVMPYPTLSDSNALYYSFVVGRVRFIVTDQRYVRTAAPSGSILGATQKQWLKDRLSDAEPVKVWVTDSVFNTSETPAGEDKWHDYPAEHDEIGDYIRDDAVGLVVILSGDQHAVAADDGSGNVWGIPSWCAAPFDRTASHKGGPWSEGLYPATEGAVVNQYGWVAVTDTGTAIDLDFTGYDSSNVARVTHNLSAVTSQAGTITTTVGNADAAGGSVGFSGTAAFTTVVGTATADGGSAAFTAGGTTTTAVGTATAEGGAASFTAASMLTTSVGTATADGGTVTFTAGGSGTLSTLEGNADASGGTVSFAASSTFSTAAGESTADGGVVGFSAGGSASFATSAGLAVTGGGQVTFAADSVMATIGGDAAASGGLASFGVAAILTTLVGLADADGGQVAFTAGAVLATLTGTATAAGGTTSFGAPGSQRDITVTVTGPTGHPLRARVTGNPLVVTGPTS